MLVFIQLLKNLIKSSKKKWRTEDIINKREHSPVRSKYAKWEKHISAIINDWENYSKL